MDSRRIGKTGEMSFSATRGTAASGARRLRDPRFVFDARELAEYDLPRLSESRPGLLALSKQKSGSAAQSAAVTASAGDGSPSASSDATGTLPPIFPSDAARRGARLTSSTLAVVRDAYGIEDAKRQEVEDVASTILAKTYGQQHQKRGGASAAKPASPRRPSVSERGAPDERSAKALSDADAAQQAMDEAAELATGEEAIAYFLKHGPACPVKFVHLVRKYPASHDTFRPYDLVVVPEVRRGRPTCQHHLHSPTCCAAAAAACCCCRRTAAVSTLSCLPRASSTSSPVRRPSS